MTKKIDTGLKGNQKFPKTISKKHGGRYSNVSFSTEPEIAPKIIIAKPRYREMSSPALFKKSINSLNENSTQNY